MYRVYRTTCSTYTNAWFNHRPKVSVPKQISTCFQGKRICSYTPLICLSPATQNKNMISSNRTIIYRLKWINKNYSSECHTVNYPQPFNFPNSAICPGLSIKKLFAAQETHHHCLSLLLCLSLFFRRGRRCLV